jgi:GntR family transcriptional regulator
VPSVRDLARGLAVNPATVAKAYQRLADAGVLTVRRGDGTYVAASPPAISGEQRAERLRAEALRYASFAVTLGASSREAEAALVEAWRALANPPAASPPAAGKQDAASAATGAGDAKGADGGFT